MKIVANSLNGVWTREVVNWCDTGDLLSIELAVAYTSRLEELLKLSSRRKVPLNLYTLADGDGFPSLDVARNIVLSSNASWRLYLIRNFYHPKIMWFRGVGAYIGSANLSDRAWSRNQECGIWMDEEELYRENWIEQLGSIFMTVRSSCKEATLEDIESLDAIKRRKDEMKSQESAFDHFVNKMLSGIPGDRPLTDQTVSKNRGGAARKAFLDEWELSLTTLRKLSKRFEENMDRWPAWVDRTAAPSIVQDQATEAWWEHEFRHTGESGRLMEESHRRNRSRLLDAESDLISYWENFQPKELEKWQRFVNDSPSYLREHLTREALANLDEDALGEILSRCHAAIAHSRQMKNADYGLAPEAKTELQIRVRYFAEYLWKARSASGRAVLDVLQYVLWGDLAGSPEDKSPASRIWAALHEDQWKLPHLGAHILGELIGYARPDEYPPRNNRVSKTLYALGHEGIRFD